MSAALVIEQPVLPWESAREERLRFRLILWSTVFVFLAVGAVLPFLPLPLPGRKALEELPPRLARIIVPEKRITPPAPRPKPERKAEPKAQPRPEARPAPKTPGQTVAQARKKAAQSGLLQFTDALSDMRESLDIATLAPGKPLSRSGATAKELAPTLSADNAVEASGGIDTSGLSRETGGTALATRETTQVTSPIIAAQKEQEKKAKRRLASRSTDEIRAVFNRHRGAIYALYNRALRKEPLLRGEVVLELVIEPSGEVSACRILSSELKSPALERKLVARVLLFRFAAKQVARTTVSYPIEFLPS